MQWYEEPGRPETDHHLDGSEPHLVDYSVGAADRLAYGITPQFRNDLS